MASYQYLVEQSGGGRRQLELRRKKLIDQLSKNESDAEAIEVQAAELDNLQSARVELLDKLEEVRQKLFESRKAQSEEIQTGCQGKLRLTLSYAADKSAFAARLHALLKGSSARQADSDRAAERMDPRRFVDLVLAGNVEALSTEAGLALENALRFIKHLTGSAERLPFLLSLQHSCLPSDVPSIEFMKDDGQFYPISDLSLGQKSTALVMIALVQGRMPVVIDQPEDSLDIPSIWQDVVLKLRNTKELRQFIMTTHNSSVAVASDSDQFLILRSSSSHGRIEVSGGIDEEPVRLSVIQHLEGGQDAYHLKRRKYNL
jgi:hypothetical protein